MNTDTLKTFLLLAELKNYTHTANQLFVAQSTVTNRIQELEAELGKALFVRSRKSVQLTEQGERFLAYARRILELTQSAAEELNSMLHYRSSLRIGSTNTIYDCHLSRKLVDYSLNHPDTKLNLVIAHSHALIQMLQDRTLDIAFSYVPCAKNALQCSLFTTDELLLVTGPQNQAYRHGILQQELAGIPYLYCDFPFQEVGSYIRDLFPAGHAFPLEIDRSANLLPFLYGGKGYSFLPASMVRNSIDRGTLLTVPLLDFSIPRVNCYLLTRGSLESDALLAALQPESF
ncbi:LysR family transcriptional regulator [Faecalispora anaeroviscerum]|uniref:LysR family transcriptional regulator n=1 Tax=Faecalispora anaeroviscerum TaxID=2991836 RepID=UPI0024BA69A9|nr:LysR family transcriptional regulator [Faecalispora anaeroviscerum]